MVQAHLLAVRAFVSAALVLLIMLPTLASVAGLQEEDPLEMGGVVRGVRELMEPRDDVRTWPWALWLWLLLGYGALSAMVITIFVGNNLPGGPGDRRDPSGS